MNPPDKTENYLEKGSALWIILLLLAAFAVLVCICVVHQRCQLNSMKRKPNQDSHSKTGNKSDDKYSDSDSGRRRRYYQKKDKKVQARFFTEQGMPLLYSYDEYAYDDAAFLVDRTFEKSY